MQLVSEYRRVAQMMSFAGSMQWNLVVMREDLLSRIEHSPDQDLKNCTKDLLKRFAAWTQPLQTVEAAALFEEYGEAVCLLEIKSRGAVKGLKVRRLSTQPRAKVGLKTPDIECTMPDGEIFYIEIKVLDMAGNHIAAKELIEDAFENRIEMEQRFEPSTTFSRPLVISPHGKGALGRPRAALLDNYIRRVNSNVKKAQVTVGPTFLLIFDARIPLSTYDSSCLAPAYYQLPRGTKQILPGECVSGDWWHVGFGESGDLLLGESEFEGKGNLGGRLRADGVLVSHPYLFGLSVLSQMHSKAELRLFTLAQTERSDLPETERFEAFEPDTAANFFSDAFNDARNSGGWQYQTRT